MPQQGGGLVAFLHALLSNQEKLVMLALFAQVGVHYRARTSARMKCL